MGEEKMSNRIQLEGYLYIARGYNYEEYYFIFPRKITVKDIEPFVENILTKMFPSYRERKNAEWKEVLEHGIIPELTYSDVEELEIKLDGEEINTILRSFAGKKIRIVIEEL